MMYQINRSIPFSFEFYYHLFVTPSWKSSENSGNECESRNVDIGTARGKEKRSIVFSRSKFRGKLGRRKFSSPSNRSRLPVSWNSRRRIEEQARHSIMDPSLASIYSPDYTVRCDPINTFANVHAVLNWTIEIAELDQWFTATLLYPKINK